MNDVDLSLVEQASALFIQDNKDDNQEIVSLLQNKCKDITLFNNSDDAFKYYQNNPSTIDILLIDLNSNDSIGIDLMKKIRSLGDWEIPFIVTSSFNESNILLEVIKLKVSNVVLKPFQENTFLKIVAETISLHKKNRLIQVQQKELEHFKFILDKLNMVSETDLKGVITYVNRRFCDVTGFSKEELVGKTHKLIRHSDTSNVIYKKMWENIQSEKPWFGKLKNKTKEGQTYYAKTIIIPIFDDNGEPLKYMSSGFVITDIEEEKQKLKKFIFSQKLDKVNTQKMTQEEVNNKARDLVLKARQDLARKEEKFVSYLKELEAELKRLRIRRETDKKQLAFLEKEYKEYIDTTDKEKKIFQEKMEKALNVGRSSYEKAIFLKKKSDSYAIKLKKSQDGIKTLQAYVDEYREKIKNLQDVIAAHEKTIEELRTPKN